MSSGSNIETSTVGQPLPPSDHAISVSLPTWLETLGYKKGDSHIIDRMQTGYPRYFIHLSIRKVRVELATSEVQTLILNLSSWLAFLKRTSPLPLNALYFSSL